jgi:hypothetical protein
MSDPYPLQFCQSAEGWQGQLFGQCLAAIIETSAAVSKVRDGLRV